MRCWVVGEEPGSTESLRLVDRAVPRPADDEILVQVAVCGVCRTDLHLVLGELPPRRPLVSPGHQVVGRVVEVGGSVQQVRVGDRVGVAWLRSTCGQCRWCRSGAENLCPRSTYTGWDADGGFAEYLTVPAAYAYRLDEHLPDDQVAPLLCAGIIGYRALRRASLPPGGRLGIYGFGSSAHLTAQVALAQGAELHVLTRGSSARALATELGAAFAGDAVEGPPRPLDAAILFAPVGDLVPVALAALERGGTLVVAGIHLSDVPPLVYDRHLFLERTLTSVTANTRSDGEELLRLAAALRIAPRVQTYDFDDAPAALRDLDAGLLAGTGVLRVALASQDTSRGE
jgi:alcohol dehydrogenase, propanol-preferring